MLLAGVVAALAAAAPSRAAPGAVGADYLKIGAGARPAALGEAYAGLADDVYAADYNPAGLAGLRRQEAAFDYDRLLPGVVEQELEYALPTADFGTFAAGARALQVDRFSGFDANDVPLGSVSSQDLAVGVDYAYGWGPLSLGAGGKYLNSRLADARASGAAWDAGALYELGPAARLGVSVANLGGGLKFDSASAPLPRVVRAGASVRLYSSADTWLLVAVQESLPNDRAPYPSAGAEYGLARIFAVRAGYTGRLDAAAGWSVGGSLKLIHAGYSWYSASQYSSSVPDVEFDYAFSPAGALGGEHRFGVVVRFGEDKAAEDGGPPEVRPQDGRRGRDDERRKPRRKEWHQEKVEPILFGPSGP